MGGGQRRKATYADLEAAPPHLVAELVDGELYLSPRPASRHALAHAALHGELYNPFHQGRGGPGGWLLLFEPELHLGEDVLVPDIAGWRRERMPEMPDVVGFTLAPDWLCEVLSPSTAALDREKKMKLYGRAGVRHLWLVDPLRQSLEVYALEGNRWQPLGTHTGQAQVHAEPFTPLRLELGLLWQR
ncbi:Uma2 family endonuclease [Archangium lansingense]|uniref:Uma2 family endonuclease n=1 Tax=Archangium lansingense TaxID=2995310 RepID=A0ABT4AQR0_9BACT|nr:Uma2 family endonuclease [Archangium lansinium]MCY1083509.1 Uma2 family endonuclease [Archangium lansinium]